MRLPKIERKHLPLLFIAALSVAALAGAAALFRWLGRDLAGDQIVKALLVLDDGGKLRAADLLLFDPATRKAELFDVPPETGLIIQRLGRTDRIDALYSRDDPEPFRAEVAGIFAVDVPWVLRMDMGQVERLVDLVGGYEVLVGNPVDLAPAEKGGERVRIPAGTVTLDGAKAAQYLSYDDPQEIEAARTQRLQRGFQLLLRCFADRAPYILDPRVYPLFSSCVSTNLSGDGLAALVRGFAGMAVDGIITQRLSGTKKQLEGKTLLFLHYDGQLIKDIVKQSLRAIARDTKGKPEKGMVRIDVLNGTPVKGLAKSLAEIYQGYGYEIASVGNADSFDYDKTVVIDHTNNPDAAKEIAGIIKCSRVTAEPDGPAADEEAGPIVYYTVIIGKDFNGRTCSD